MTDYAEQIRLEQVAALATIKRVAESLPGFTFSSEFDTIDGEAGLPCACDAKQPLTPNRPS
jgi:hypothetical protein